MSRHFEADTHTLTNEGVQKVVVRTEHNPGILHEFSGSEVRTGAQLTAETHQFLDVPGLVQPMCPLQGALISHFMHIMVVPAWQALK